MLAPIVMDIASQALPMAGLDNARRPMMRYEPGVEPGESEVSKIEDFNVVSMGLNGPLIRFMHVFMGVNGNLMGFDDVLKGFSGIW
jgi:hypothetical protein